MFVLVHFPGSINASFHSLQKGTVPVAPYVHPPRGRSLVFPSEAFPPEGLAVPSLLSPTASTASLPHSSFAFVNFTEKGRKVALDRPPSLVHTWVALFFAVIHNSVANVAALVPSHTPEHPPGRAVCDPLLTFRSFQKGPYHPAVQ